MRALPICLALGLMWPRPSPGNPDSGAAARKPGQPTAAGFLGLSTLPVPPALRAHLQPAGDHGLLVDGVLRGSPADHGAIQRHDIILKFNGQQIDTQAEFSALVTSTAPGTEVTITLLHAGREAQRKVILGTAPAALKPADPEHLERCRAEVAAALKDNPAALDAVYRFLFSPDSPVKKPAVPEEWSLTCRTEEEHRLELTSRDGLRTLRIFDSAGTLLAEGNPADAGFRQKIAPEMLAFLERMEKSIEEQR